MGDCYGIAEGEDLVSFALEGVTEPTAVNHKTTSDSGAFGLITNKSDVHKYLV